MRESRRKEEPLETTIQRIRRITSTELDLTQDEITPDSSFVDDLGADSLDVVELVMAFEEEFDIEILDSDAEKLVTVKDVVEYIDGRIS